MYPDVDLVPLHSREPHGAPHRVFHPAVQVLAYSKGPGVERYPAVPVRYRLRQFLRNILVSPGDNLEGGNLAGPGSRHYDPALVLNIFYSLRRPAPIRAY